MKICTLIVSTFLFTSYVSVASAGTPTSIYISPRTDGIAGTGTSGNPYDGSTEAKFDALMKSIGPNTTINLAAGTYSTGGADAFSVKSGWTLQGAGEGKTILKLVPYPTTNTKHYHLCGSYTTGVVVSNLTCDSNYTPGAWPAHHAVGGIFIVGTGTTIDTVEVTHAYGDSKLSLEQFSILICGSSTQMASNLTIKNCLTHEYAAGATYTNGPGISGSNNNQILNCTDDGSNHGFGFSDTTNSTISGCTTTFNTNLGFYTDTGTNSGVTIENNDFAASIPIGINSAAANDNYVIADNILEANNSTGANEAAIALAGESGRDYQITGNVFVFTGTSANAGLVVIHANDYSELTIENNSSNVGLAATGPGSSSVAAVSTVSGNKFNESITQVTQDKEGLSAGQDTNGTTETAQTNSAPAASAATSASTASPAATSPSAGSTSASAASSTTSSAAAGTQTATSSAASTAASSAAAAKAAAAKTAAVTSNPAVTVSQGMTSAKAIQELAQVLAMATGPTKQLLLQQVLGAWTRQDPAAAAAYVQKMPNGIDKLNAEESVAENWMAINPAAAVAWLDSLHNTTAAGRS